MEREQQRRDEETCAKAFLTWLKGSQGAEWTFVRCEDRFPELANKTRWEFVGRRTDGAGGWMGLEVKSLVSPEQERQYGDWDRLLRDTYRGLEGRLAGRYLLARVPKYRFTQAQRTTLVHCLQGAILKVAASLDEGEQRDIGPDVATCFTDWPDDMARQLSVDRETPEGRVPPHQLVLLRTSVDGSSLRIAWYPPAGLEGTRALRAAIGGLLQGGRGANAQLGLARAKGAARTVLLLDERISFDPWAVRQALRELESSRLSSVDEVYLVSTFSGEHVAQVWLGGTSTGSVSVPTD